MFSNTNSYIPAGYESDGSGDEWDIGCCSSNQEHNSEVTLSANDDVSILKKAITSGDVDVVQKLLDSGMDVETQLGFGWTPLMCAVQKANYDLAKLMLDHGANASFSRDDYTVLMAACTAASATEEKISKCVALLLSRNADPNTCNRSRKTCLMLAARAEYCRVINTLVSHGAELDFQDDYGHTALMFAVLSGSEDTVLNLLQLGADKSVKNKAGKTAADLAIDLKHSQISKILNSRNDTSAPSKAESIFKFLSRNPEAPSDSKESCAKLFGIELLLHGLNLEHLADIMMENDITWSCLLTMEKDELEQIGVTDGEDQKKLLSAIQEMQLDIVDLDTVTQLGNIDSGSEELYNFLISLRQQCCYLTETVHDVISRFPRSPCEIVLTLDPKKEAQGICTDIAAQVGDLQKELTCLKDLLDKMDPTISSLHPAVPSSHTSGRRQVLKKLVVGVLAAGLLLLLSRTRLPNVCLAQ